MINVIGTIWGTQGYAVHTKNLARELNKLTEVKITTDLPRGFERVVEDDVLQMIKRKGIPEANLIIAQPSTWKQHTDAKTNIGFLVWEGDRIPKSWIEECLNPRIHIIFVASEHTKQAIKNSMGEDYGTIEKKIFMVPHGIDKDLWVPKKEKSVGTQFKFLCNKGFRNLEDRGGIQYAIKAYIEEFKKEENVELVLKINPAYGTPDVSKMANMLGFNENSPKIRVITENVPYEQLPKLYQDCDVFVSPTRAEAFNIPCLEAMAVGLPVIATNFGGQTDFVTEENGWLVDYDLKQVQHEVMYEEVQWAIPKVKELRKAMREAFVGELGTKSQKARAKAEEYTWEASARKAFEAIETFIM